MRPTHPAVLAHHHAVSLLYNVEGLSLLAATDDGLTSFKVLHAEGIAQREALRGGEGGQKLHLFVNGEGGRVDKCVWGDAGVMDSRLAMASCS